MITNLPTESVLNWSSEKPAFEQVKGKWVYAEDTDGNKCGLKVNQTAYLVWFNERFSRYAIIAEPLEAKELWGVKPELKRFRFWRGTTECVNYSFCLKYDGVTVEQHTSFDTEAEAITAWNHLRDKIEGER